MLQLAIIGKRNVVIDTASPRTISELDLAVKGIDGHPKYVNQSFRFRFMLRFVYSAVK